MATNTKNYNLVKPAENELADINVLNKNMDVIDEQILPVNSLVSDDSKKALAAAQGKILNGKIGDLSALTTEHKGNLVQAINDAADGAGITVVTESQYQDMQKAGTVDADKLYGIVDAFDSSAGNVGISDTLSAKLGITTDKNVEKAIDAVDTKVSQNAKATITEVNKSLNDVIKKDGSVQMTGVLKTVGGTGVQPQIDTSGGYIYNTESTGTVTIACNCYYDGTNWRYRKDGKASFLGVLANATVPNFWYADTGVKDAIITWTQSDILTTKTGLPLTGGTLTGNLQMYSGSLIYRMALDPNYFSFLASSNNGLNGYEFRIRNIMDLTNALSIRDGYTGAVYNIYGTHNITCSTTAPTGTLAEGSQHQVYA